MANELLNAALQYHRDGMSVIPIQPSGKQPLISWSEYTTRRATEEEVRSWWGKWPNANIGVVTGAISSVFVVDIDPKHGGTAESIYATARTGRIAKTGSGGFHLFYRHPGGTDGIPNRVGVQPGVDVRGDGGYVVVPPSSHQSGRLYSWVRTGDPGHVTPTLRKLLATVRQEQQDGEPEKWISDLLQGTTKGGRNDACARLSGYLAGKGLPRDVVLGIIRQWNVKNDPPLPDDEVATTVESVHKTVRRREQPKQQIFQEGATGHTFDVVNLRDYMVRHGGSKSSWLVDGWLPDSTIAFVVAPPESYKTWLLFDLVVSVATGMDFLGQYKVNSSGPVLVIQQEDYHGDVAERLAAIISSRLSLTTEASDNEDEFAIRSPPDIPIFIHPDRHLRFSDSTVMALLEQRIQEIRPKVVVLDPLYSAAESDDYMAKDAGRMFALKRMRDLYGCSFVIAHHTKKGASDNTNREGGWGSQFLNAFLETGWQVRPTDIPGTVRVRRHTKSARAPMDIRIEWDINTEVPPYRYNPKILDDAQEDTNTASPASILDLLARSSGISIKDISDSFGVHRSTISRRLKAMEKDGVIRKTSSGLYVLPKNLPDF